MSTAKNIEAVYPLSGTQEGLLFHALLASGVDPYLQQVSCELRGVLHVGAFERAWQRLVERHAILRTAFLWEDLEQPLQVVGCRVKVPLRHEDWRLLAAADREARWRTLLAEERRRGLPLARAPLMRLVLARVGERRFRFLWTFHHLLVDGWSTARLLRELFALYDDFRCGQDPRLPAPRPFRDFIDWLRQRDLAAAESFWRRLLAGFDTPTRLPFELPLAARGERRPAVQRITLSPAASETLRAFARRRRLTLGTVLQGAWALLLSRFSGQRDVVFGLSVSGRPEGLPGAESMIGPFINTLPVRLTVRDAEPLSDWLCAIQKQRLDAQQYEYSPLSKVQTWSGALPSGAQLFDSLLVVENYPLAGSLGSLDGLELHDVVADEGTHYPLTLVVLPGRRLSFELKLDSGRVAAARARSLLEQLRALLADIAASDGRRRLGDLSLLSPAVRHQVVTEWNDPPASYRLDLCIHQWLEAQAERTPEAVAVVAEEGQLSYRQLDRSANRLARRLRQLGARPETRVAVCLERSLDLVVALLGVWKAGAAYVPLDPTYPRARLAFMAEDAGAAVTVTQRHHTGFLEAAGGRFLDPAAASDPLTAADDAEPPAGGPSTDNLAYVIYTSGSTGRPKGVMVPHRAIANRLLWMQSIHPVGPGDRVLQKTPFSFDASIWELFLPLMFGAELVLARGGGHRDSGYLVEAIVRYRITILQLVPSMLGVFLAEPGLAACRSLRQLFSGGEALPQELVDRLKARLPAGVTNLYGPTEAAIDATSQVSCERGAAAAIVPIGRPISNMQVFVVDASGEVGPTGLAGELRLGGAGLARGYLDRPGWTAERFVPHPFSRTPGERLYCTGDLGAHRPDGILDFRGRIDLQVKVQGLRIEPGEIEARLNQHPAVVDAVVLAVPTTGGGSLRLVAYYIASGTPVPEPSELRSWLGRQLPEHMVPAALVPLDAFPTLPNGKVDRESLAELGAPAPELGRVTAPRTLSERILAEIWGEVLGNDSVSAHVGFLEAGGHSLPAILLLSRIRRAFQVELPLSAVFEAPDLAALARVIETERSGSDPAALPAIQRRPPGIDPPLSFAQQRMWFLHQLDPASAAYNVPLAVRLKGDLHLGALAASLEHVVHRHEILRTTFVSRGGRPAQRIAERGRVPLAQVDLSRLPAAERELRRLLTLEARRPFDLAEGPLLRTTLLRLGAREHVLQLTLHHIISDAWSNGIFVRETAALYEAFLAGDRRPCLPPLPIQYADFASWQREWLEGEILSASLRFWKERLGGRLPTLRLPGDRPRGAVVSTHGGRRPVHLPGPLVADLERLSKRRGTTLFMTLVASFKILLFRHTGDGDLIVGTPSANRDRSEIESLIGYFVNTLVLRTSVAGRSPFVDVLRRVRGTVLAAVDHREMPFELLVEALQPDRELSRAPLFQVMFALQNAPTMELRLPGLNLEPMELDSGTAKFDLLLELTETAGGVVGGLEYASDLFDPATIDRMAGHLRRLLEGIVADPERPVWQLPLLSAAERHQMRWEHPPQTAVRLAEDLLPRRFEVVARRTPQAESVSCGAERLSYGELNRRANRLAYRLRRLGVGPEVPVGLLCERTVQMVVGVLGILKAGGAYLPLDPQLPPQRLHWMLWDAGATTLVTHGESGAEVPPGVRAVPVEGGAEAGDDADPRWPLPSAGAAAYIIYTSGSTGRPKGVVVSHANVLRLFDRTEHWFGFAATDVWTLFHSIAFDFSVWEIWGALLYGGRVVVVPYHSSRSPEAFYQLLQEEGVTFLNQTPSAFRQLIRHEEREVAELSLRYVVFGGEALEMAALRPWFATHGDRRPELVNMYGITETTVHVTYRPLAEEDAEGRPASLIGGPIPDLRTWVLDPAGGLLPIGAAGELYVGGAGVARGYLGRPRLTAERFIPDPFDGNGERLYRTGDLVRRRPSGELEYLGRIDHQVKIRGFRIELGEIESVLASNAAVRQAVVVARGEGDGRHLVAYWVPVDAAGEGAEELRACLRQHLPEYMVPAFFVPLAELPLTANGKIDRRALPEPEREPSGSDEAVEAPATPVEEVLAGIWCEVLECEQVGVEDNFFDLGGHSLLATQVASRLRQAFAVELPLRDLFEAVTLRQLAQRVENVRSADSLAAPPIEPVPRDGDLPLSFAQQRLWFLDHLSPGNAAFNVAGGLRMSGPLQPRALQQALSEIGRRHEILRTHFETRDGSPIQIIAPPQPFALPLVDLSILAPQRRQAETEKLGAAEARRPFDLARGPLLRLLLIRDGHHRHVLFFTLHHIVTDGWSAGVIVRELGALYAAFVRGEASPLPELAIQYADFVHWQRRWMQGEVLASQVAYWKRQLADAPKSLELPLDRPRSAVQVGAGLTRALAIRRVTPEELKRVGRRRGATLFMTSMAAFKVLLHHLSGASDLVVGTDVANRNRGETEKLVGFFINQLALRTDLGGNPSFGELLGRVREVTLGAFDHQDVPFEKLVEVLQLERDLSRSPIFQVKLFLQNAPMGALELPGLTLEPVETERGAANLDLTVALWEQGEELAGWVNYRSDLFAPRTIDRLVIGFEAVLAAIVEDPEIRLEELRELLTQLEKEHGKMEKKRLKKAGFTRLKGIKPKLVDLPQAEVVQMELLKPDQNLPLVIRPLVEDVDLADWAASHRDLIDEKLQVHGAILFRGFGLRTPEEFERFASQVATELYSENAEHPRESISGNVYTPVFFPPDQQLLWHNENSFNHCWPMKIMFCCVKAAAEGGETPIVDSRRLLERIQPETRRAFEEKQVMYMRNYSNGLGLDWQTVFQTSDRKEIEQYASNNRMTLEWTEDGKLRTRAVRPAIVKHPKTGERSWFNQAQHWHVSCLDPETRRSMEALFAEEQMPRQCYFGDSTAIPQEMMKEVLEAYRELEVSFPWQEGDVMVLDNLLTAHGRNPFVGPRKLLVAMGEMNSYDQV